MSYIIFRRTVSICLVSKMFDSISVSPIVSNGSAEIWCSSWSSIDPGLAVTLWLQLGVRLQIDSRIYIFIGGLCGLFCI